MRQKAYYKQFWPYYECINILLISHLSERLLSESLIVETLKGAK